MLFAAGMGVGHLSRAQRSPFRTLELSMFGPYSMVHTANHETDPDKPLQERGYIKQPVSIGKEVWIAMGVIILPGVTIGDGVIVVAGSVIIKDLPPYTLAVGNPCKVIKQRK